MPSKKKLTIQEKQSLIVKDMELIKETPDRKVYKCPKTGRRKVFTINNEPSKTDPSFADECDANHIMQKFQQTGQITHVTKTPGQYLDVSYAQDLHESMIQVQAAKEEFSSLPAKVRSRFNHDMRAYVDFMMDPKNDEEAIDLGLKKKVIKPDDYPKGVDKPKKEVNGESSNKDTTGNGSSSN
jgi:hypothetical protein